MTTAGSVLDAAPATPGASAHTLNIGPFPVWPPVVLAPMAGITNASFRRLCREFGGAGGTAGTGGTGGTGGTAAAPSSVSAGLYVCEMITTRAMVERDRKTMEMIRFAPEENPRSLQDRKSVV